MAATVGPRIYNLFPPLVGAIDRWNDHVRRAAHMGFNWIYLNPIHATGFSGSLYAIRDFYLFNPLLLSDDPTTAERQLGDFITRTHERGLRVMMDLAINHTARDARLVGEHPEWYRRDESGDLYSPRAIDPADTAKVTVWGDLAELDYANPGTQNAVAGYWADYLQHFTALGVDGFRCDAAYMVPPSVWRDLIARTRQAKPDTTFCAETLGCTVTQTEALAGCGFDYLFNSSKWWDFRSDWLLEQYDHFRAVAPSISFPESHDTERVAGASGSNDPEQIGREARFRYTFAACYATGVMIPVGYEFGFRKHPHVVETRPTDWEDTGVDISDTIAAINAMKATLPALNQEGPQRILTAPGSPAVALLRECPDRNEAAALVLINADRAAAHSFEPLRLIAESDGSFEHFSDITPLMSPLEMGTSPLVLEPFDIRVFRADRRGEAPKRRKVPAVVGRAAPSRVVVENVAPVVDDGRYTEKRVVGETLEVSADIFCDGHDTLAAAVLFRRLPESEWKSVPLAFADNDRWSGRIPLTHTGEYRFVVEAWRDLFQTWRNEVSKKIAARQSVTLELEEGRKLVTEAAKAQTGRNALLLQSTLDKLEARRGDGKAWEELLLSDSLAVIMTPTGPRADVTRTDAELPVLVERPVARYGAWYELFPRSASDDVHRHGTFHDVVARLPYIKKLGFDVLYMPPIHPIGRTNRKGRNNSLRAEPDDPGSPYAIGGLEGGHTAIHPQLGTIEDFRDLVKASRDAGLEIALDFAIQCSLDHPWIKEHPTWFEWRSDGSIKFAENPPKRYEDIVNIQFEGRAFPAVWNALRDVVAYWASEGVRIFRVDNPHTKPVPFWAWLIADLRARFPDILFLAEAFTRPKMMRKLAKVGFSQSYTYFTWRNTKQELTQYLTELTQSPMRDYFRPNFFVNTPDINPPFLQTGGRAAFVIRAMLAGTLCPAWGMYSGFELCEATPLPGREEYLDAEKYEIKAWDWDRPGNIRDEIAALNHIRRKNPALHEFVNLRFYQAFDDHVLFYGKATANRDNVLWFAVSLDPHNVRECTLELPFGELGLSDDATLHAEELLTGTRMTWTGRYQHLRLEPSAPARIWRLSA